MGELEDGEGEYKRGYGYEYLQKLSYITGWKYEYVYDSFKECYEMLVNGDIDLYKNLEQHILITLSSLFGKKVREIQKGR